MLPYDEEIILEESGVSTLVSAGVDPVPAPAASFPLSSRAGV